MANMTAKSSKKRPSRKEGGNDAEFEAELVVNEGANVAVFHKTPFEQDLSWLEFDLDTKRLTFVLADGDVRNFGILIPDDFSRDMQNAHQVLMVHKDEKTDEPLSGQYFPLIIHRA